MSCVIDIFKNAFTLENMAIAATNKPAASMRVIYSL